MGQTSKMYTIVDKEQRSEGYTAQGVKGESLTVIECVSAVG